MLNKMTAGEAMERAASSVIRLEEIQLNTPCDDDVIALQDGIDALQKIASGELREVVHGRWVNMPFNVDNDKYGMNKYNMRIKCTNCGFVTSSDLHYARCPVCGALMDGKDEEK